EPDGSLFAAGASAPTEKYTITAAAALRQITAIRLEALPDERLPGGGPGRGPKGDFFLTGIKLKVTPRASGATQPATKPSSVDIPFASAQADVEAADGRAAGAIDDRDDTGWSAGATSAAAHPISAIFVPKSPIVCGEGATL